MKFLVIVENVGACWAARGSGKNASGKTIRENFVGILILACGGNYLRRPEMFVLPGQTLTYENSAGQIKPRSRTRSGLGGILGCRRGFRHHFRYGQNGTYHGSAGV